MASFAWRTETNMRNRSTTERDKEWKEEKWKWETECKREEEIEKEKKERERGVEGGRKNTLSVERMRLWYFCPFFRLIVVHQCNGSSIAFIWGVPQNCQIRQRSKLRRVILGNMTTIEEGVGKTHILLLQLADKNGTSKWLETRVREKEML